MGIGNIMNTSGFNVSGIMGLLYKFAMIIVVGLVALFIVWIIIYVLKFNKKIMLIQEVGGSMRIEFDRGMRDTKKKEFKVLRNRNVDYAYPTSKHEVPSGRGSMIPFVVKNQQAVPICGISDNPHFIPADINMFNHLVARIKLNEELTSNEPSWWDKHGQAVLLVTMMTILFVSIILILKRVDDALEMGKSSISMANAKSRQVVEGITMMIALQRNKK